jgi:hypothetical protein
VEYRISLDPEAAVSDVTSKISSDGALSAQLLAGFGDEFKNTMTQVSDDFAAGTRTIPAGSNQTVQMPGGKSLLEVI